MKDERLGETGMVDNPSDRDVRGRDSWTGCLCFSSRDKGTRILNVHSEARGRPRTRLGPVPIA